MGIKETKPEATVPRTEMSPQKNPREWYLVLFGPMKESREIFDYDPKVGKDAKYSHCETILVREVI